ncbi:MAG: cation-transporting P-type ATPase [archaeon]
MEKRGLTKEEAEAILERFGTNEIQEVSLNTPLRILTRQIKNNFIIYLLLAAMLISFFVGKSITAYTIIAVIVMVVSLGFIQEYRADKAIKALKKIILPVSIVIRDNKEQEILSTQIVPGDILVLRSGEKIPADCIILEEKELYINESILTGESKEIKKETAKNLKKYSDKNLIFMGSFVVNGKCLANVLHTGMNTKFGKIAHMISTAEKELPLQKKINKIAKYMATLAITVSILTGLLMLWRAPELSQTFVIEALILVIALSVSAFPEGFPVVLITTLASGARKMAKENAIVNRMSTIETLGETTVICSDKTGTITKGEMTVNRIFSDNKIIEISGTGYEASGDFTSSGKKISIGKEPVLDLLLRAAISCNDSRIERAGEENTFKISGTPTEAALLIMAAKQGLYKEDLKLKRIEEIPFSSERKRMTVVCKREKENFVFSKGALEFILEKCAYIQRHNGVFKLTTKDKKKILKENIRMTSQTLRTLAITYKKVSVFEKRTLEQDLIFLGLVGMEDPPREGVKESIKICLKAGIKVKMITGDNKETALSIANQIGLRGKVMEGHELDRITDEELSKVIGSIVILARVKPEHKLRIVKALKANGEIVTMTGDGVNDAPALKEAHIGVAMGKNGTDVSREVADLTLKDDDFTTIVSAIKEGRTIFRNVRKFVTYQLSCNFAELTIIFVGVLLTPLLGWQIPLLFALQILFMNLVTDNLPAITLGFNPSSTDVMDATPRKKSELLNKNFIILLILTGSLLALFVLTVFFFTFNILDRNIEYARTTALVSLITLEIASAFNFRSFRKGVLNRSPLVNKYLVYASIISLIATLAIVYTPLNKVFETVPITLADWGIAIAFSLALLAIFDIAKKINNKKKFLNLMEI